VTTVLDWGNLLAGLDPLTVLLESQLAQQIRIALEQRKSGQVGLERLRNPTRPAKLDVHTQEFDQDLSVLGVMEVGKKIGRIDLAVPSEGSFKGRDSAFQFS
jgi:hypothetical protein